MRSRPSGSQGDRDVPRDEPARIEPVADHPLAAMVLEVTDPVPVHGRRVREQLERSGRPRLLRRGGCHTERFRPLAEPGIRVGRDGIANPAPGVRTFIDGEKLAALEAHERRLEVVVAVEEVGRASGLAPHPVDQRREGAEHRAGEDVRPARHQLCEEDLHGLVVAGQPGDQRTGRGVLATPAIQEDGPAEVLPDRCEDLIAGRAVGADEERIVAAHARCEVADDLVSADRRRARDSPPRELVLDEVASSQVDRVEAAERRRDTVGDLQIRSLRPQALHQVDNLTTPHLVQVEEVRVMTERVRADVQVQRFLLLLAEDVDIASPVAEALEVEGVGRRCSAETEHGFEDRRPCARERMRRGYPRLQKALVGPGDRDVEEIENLERRGDVAGLQVGRQPSRQAKAVWHEDAIGQMGQHDRDVERHLVVAEAAVVPGDEEPAHEC